MESPWTRTLLLASFALLLFAVASPALAKSRDLIAAEAKEMQPAEVERDAAELIDELRVRPEDRDVADTAMVFTNFTGKRQRVICAAFDRNGRIVGKSASWLPPYGLRFVLASDVADDLDFIGSAQCSAHKRVRGTAVFLGPGLTDLPVRQVRGHRLGRMAFPLIATY